MNATFHTIDEGDFLHGCPNNKRIYLIEVNDRVGIDIHPDFLKVVIESGGVVDGTDGYFRNKKSAIRAIGKLIKLIGK